MPHQWLPPPPSLNCGGSFASTQQVEGGGAARIASLAAFETA